MTGIILKSNWNSCWREISHVITGELVLSVLQVTRSFMWLYKTGLHNTMNVHELPHVAWMTEHVFYYLYTNIQKQVVYIWICIWVNVDSSNMMLMILCLVSSHQKVDIREITVLPLWLSVTAERQCCKHRVHLSSSHCSPALCQPVVRSARWLLDLKCHGGDRSLTKMWANIVP